VIFLHILRSGRYFRVASPDWDDPLDGLPGMSKGGRWNRPGSFPVVYLNKTTRLARTFVAHKLRGQPFGPEDLDPDAGPVLVVTDVPGSRYVDVVSDEGCKAAGLPASYPVDAWGKLLPHDTCWPIGDVAWQRNEPGIACRSATTGAVPTDEELAWFQRDTELSATAVHGYYDWFFGAH
jgi:hypothetical protein